jgi:hypothetical protein
MSISLQQESNWRQMATIEVRDDFDDLSQLLADMSLDFRIEPASESPTGYTWFNLMIDAGKGERRCARTAYALLSAMQHIAAEGGIPDFRIVAGEQWLQLGEADNAERSDGGPMRAASGI